jgi:alpha-L-fucosidase
MKRYLVTCIFSALLVPVQAQDPPAPVLAKRLSWFQDLRFGLILHWGAYSQIGCIESWPLVWADRKWANPAISSREAMIEFRQKYFALNRSFNPTAFEPELWARLAKRAGMKYIVFTTKHHDGFSMFDTGMTDYKVTAPACPFSKNPRANVTREIFNAFRAQGFGIGAYFSKSDWHSPYYWDPARWAEDRNPNYDTAAEPERWAKFVEFVHGQVKELMTGYGRVDILWLDGGQVRPPKQDIQMDKLAAMARGFQPHLIIVNRTAGDKYEDYRTPEQEVPEKPLDYVWESCLTMGKQWSYKPDDTYKTTNELIHLLVDIVSKGGNLLLNIGPAPDGTLPSTAVSRLREIGDWMAVNAEAIHGTRPIAPYKEGRVAFTRRGKEVYAIYLASENETALPEKISVMSLHPAPGSPVRLLGSNARLRWRVEDGASVIDIPAPIRSSPPVRHAYVFKFDL